MLGLAGCGGSASHHPVAAAVTATPSVTPSAAATAAAAEVERAEAALVKVRSYRFDALETVKAGSSVTTRVAGSVVRAQGVAYTLTVGRTRTQVIRLHAATFVRKLPGRWARLQKARPVTDPTTTLSAVLRGLTGVRLVGARVVDGTLPAAAASKAGIPTSGAPAQASLTFDAQGHVVRLVVHTTTTASARAVEVTLVTSYIAFDRVPALRAPV
jgi:hypothetical protein